MKLVIDRAKWLRGDGPSYLRRGEDGKLCCLGFLGLQLGLLECNLTGKGMPAETKEDCWPSWLVEVDPNPGGPSYGNTAVCNDLAFVNDGPNWDEAERESRIAAEFAKHGVEVEFV